MRISDWSSDVCSSDLSQSFNGVGGFVAPIIGGMFIFSGVEHSAAELAAMSPAELTAYRVSEAQMVQMPYLTLAGIVICIGIAIALVRLPRISHDRASAGTLPGLRSVLREPALAGAVIAQFFYVGAQ